jgi:putative SOS response-associated peptidase YedK
MCGRYASARKRQELLEEFRVERDLVAESLPPDYNVAPTKPVYAVLTRRESGSRHPEAAHREAAHPGTAQPEAAPPGTAPPSAPESAAGEPETPVRELRVVRWGLVPFWAKDVKIGSRLINARAETVSSKPAFRRAFARRRCLLPADGFYEWQAPGDGPVSDGPRGRKQPYFIHREDGGVLAFAGIYELWRDPDAPDSDPAAWLWTAAIITTEAPDDLGRIHDRTPMVIEPGRWADWLDPGQTDEATLRGLLAPAVSGALSSYPVSTEVNAVSHNGPGLIEPLDPYPDPEPAGTPAASRRATAGERGDASHGAAGKLF